MKRIRKKSGLTPFTIVLLVFLAIYVVTLAAPLLWSLLTSLKEQRDFRINIIGLPKEWAWGNYPYVFGKFFRPRRYGKRTKIRRHGRAVSLCVFVFFRLCVYQYAGALSDGVFVRAIPV